MSLNNDDDDDDEINHDDNDIRLTTVSVVMFMTMINKMTRQVNHGGGGHGNGREKLKRHEHVKHGAEGER